MASAVPIGTDPAAAEPGSSTSEFLQLVVTKFLIALFAVGVAFGINLAPGQQAALLAFALALLVIGDAVYTSCRSWRKKGTPGLNPGPATVLAPVVLPVTLPIDVAPPGTAPLTAEQQVTVRNIIETALASIDLSAEPVLQNVQVAP